MFAIIENKIITMLIQAGTAFTLNDIQYPANWCNLATQQEKDFIGMVDLIYGEQANPQYYWVSENAPVYDAKKNVVNITFTNTPKDLTGLKESSISQVNATAYSILFPTDWMVVKAMETSTTIPENWNVWRQSIRITAAQTVTAINATIDADEIQAIMSNIAWAASPDQIVI